jgi:hypothetical protein
MGKYFDLCEFKKNNIRLDELKKARKIEEEQMLDVDPIYKNEKRKEIKRIALINLKEQEKMRNLEDEPFVNEKSKVRQRLTPS